MFPFETCEIVKNTYFEEHLQMTASVNFIIPLKWLIMKGDHEGLQQLTNCLSVFDHFVELMLKRLSLAFYCGDVL